jgi:toxin FitB
MYLVDTDVLSEDRKGAKANAGVRAFFAAAVKDDAALYVSVVTIGELRRGVDMIRYRGDEPQAIKLERWLKSVTEDYADSILSFDEQAAQLWGRLRVPHPDNALDKQIAATALIHDLTVVTRNAKHFEPTGVRVLNPFS